MSATTSAASLPSPEPDEPSDVTVAIEAARALWENGDTEEALRWFSRAAEAAEQAGNDRRALDLARAVADLRDGLAPRAPAGPRPPPLPGAPAAPTPPPPAAVAKSVTRPPPPPSARKSAAPTPPSMRPRPPEATTAKSFNGPPAAESHAPARSEPPAPPPAAPAPAPAAPAPAAAKVTPAKASPEPRNDVGKGERLRVSVKSSVRDPNLLLVRVLGTGQAVPTGCHEAFLSAAQNGIDLRSPRE